MCYGLICRRAVCFHWKTVKYFLHKHPVWSASFQEERVAISWSAAQDLGLLQSVSLIRFLCQKMADFDAIYEEEDEERSCDDAYYNIVPEPIVVRGAGNMTVWVW